MLSEQPSQTNPEVELSQMSSVSHQILGSLGIFHNSGSESSGCYSVISVRTAVCPQLCSEGQNHP